MGFKCIKNYVLVENVFKVYNPMSSCMNHDNFNLLFDLFEFY